MMLIFGGDLLVMKRLTEFEEFENMNVEVSGDTYIVLASTKCVGYSFYDGEALCQCEIRIK